MSSSRVPLSVLDLAPIREGSTPDVALRQSLELAPVVEALGYERIWVAEHHNIAGVASSATAVLIGALADATSTIRVGSGGIMLPNHAPLVIAEQFGTLAALHPGRIDLGLGPRAGDRPRDRLGAAAQPAGRRRVRRRGRRAARVPGAGASRARGCGRSRARASEVPVWILGSSTYGAALAAQLGLPFAFASHFAPRFLLEAARALPRAVRAVGVAEQALHDGRRDADGGRHRRGGRAPLHLDAAEVRLDARAASGAGRCRRWTTSTPTSGRASARRSSAQMLSEAIVGGPERVADQVGVLGRAHRGRRGDRRDRRL